MTGVKGRGAARRQKVAFQFGLKGRSDGFAALNSERSSDTRDLFPAILHRSMNSRTWEAETPLIAGVDDGAEVPDWCTAAARRRSHGEI